jgi:hypothetical protein
MRKVMFRPQREAYRDGRETLAQEIPTMPEVPLYRLYALRVVFALIVLFLCTAIWPGMFHHTRVWPPMEGVARSMLAAVAIVAAIGILRPLQMIPVLFFEIAWKSTWLIAVGLPLWTGGRMDPDNAETMKACLIGVVLFSLVIPWGYVVANYVRRSADRGAEPSRE